MNEAIYTASAMASQGQTFPHAPKGSFVVMSSERRSHRALSRSGFDWFYLSFSGSSVDAGGPDKRFKRSRARLSFRASRRFFFTSP